MTAIQFPEANVVFGKDQPEYEPLPAFKADTPEGSVITCWKLTPEEIEKVRD